MKLGRIPGFTESAYHCIDYEQEGERFRSLFTRRAAPPPPLCGPLKIVGPEFSKPTGIAVYNRNMIEECTRQARDFEYVDVDSLDAPAFYAWLLANQDSNILYVMGNNNVFHNFCYDAILNVPGACIMHDSRLFEFLLNCHGPYKIVDLFNRRHKTRPIDVETVHDWARERRKLPYSILDPLVTRCTRILVHSRILEQHIRTYYRYEDVHTLPFALQLSDEQITRVMAMQATRPRGPEQIPRIVMLGETEPTKGCSEIIFALKLLHLMGIKAKLFFVGKSEDLYHEELLHNVTTLQLEEHVEFLSYVTRELYLEHLGHADVVVQLRYALFGQVSGPLGDAVACGVPVVTTEDLAQGMALEPGCTVIPNAFSPLHIAEAIRSILGGDAGERQRVVNRMGDYVTQLFALLAG
jgi:glycosyltransferase involved in cell wall biosynthesis